MGAFATVSSVIVTLCTAAACVVCTLTEWISFILHLNYEFVTAVCISVCNIMSCVFSFIDSALQTTFIIMAYVWDFLTEIYACASAFLFLVWRVLILVYKVLCFLFTGLETVVLGLWNGGVFTFRMLQQSALDVSETCESTSQYITSALGDLLLGICSIFTTIGNLSTAFVRSVWIGIGYVPSAVANFPAYIIDGFHNLWLRWFTWISGVFMGVTRETYFGVIVSCVIYFFVSKLAYKLHTEGISVFTFFRQRMAGLHGMHGHIALPLDREFESDIDEADEIDNDLNESNDGESEFNESEAHTELTISDNESDSDHSDSEGSETDVSLNSLTFSSEESDHEIDVQLPAEHYSLRSRSSTPSHFLSKDMSHEDFEREIERERDKRKCVVCQDANKSVLILPCKHMCLCVGCANQIVKAHFADRRICPLCRTRIVRVMNVFV